MSTEERSAILRFPEEDIDEINELMSKNENVALHFEFYPESRFGCVCLFDKTNGNPFDRFIYEAEILDLPRHVESYEFNSEEQGINFYNKKDDVSQIIIAKHRGSPCIINGPDTVVHDAQAPLRDESFIYRHGITPPTVNVVPKSTTEEEIQRKRTEIHEMEKAMLYSITGTEVKEN